MLSCLIDEYIWDNRGRQYCRRNVPELERGKMKRLIGYITILISVFALYGCKGKDQEANFIPTPPADPAVDEYDPSTDDKDSGTGGYEDQDQADDDGTDNNTPEYTGETTTKYVKLNTYDGILNVRATPTTDGDIVGFLVHTEQIEVIEIKDGWASFIYNGVTRYVNAAFLSDKKPAYIDPPTPTPAPTQGSSVTPHDI